MRVYNVNGDSVDRIVTQAQLMLHDHVDGVAAKLIEQEGGDPMAGMAYTIAGLQRCVCDLVATKAILIGARFTTDDYIRQGRAMQECVHDELRRMQAEIEGTVN